MTVKDAEIVKGICDTPHVRFPRDIALSAPTQVPWFATGPIAGKI
jgi:hypothetical protein